MRIVLDADKCVGHGRCYTLAPRLFDADDRGHCLILQAEPGPAEEADARSAVGNCPERALSLQD
jgi:ferredoxin